MNNEFLIYCNTRQHLTNRWKGNIFSNAFYLSDKELQRWNVTRSQAEAMPELKSVGKNKYNVVGVNEIDLSLVKPHGQPLTDLHKWMLDRVCETDMPEGIEVTQYWKSFIRHRATYPELFFTVDEFAGRIHTPISGTSKTIRPHLLLQGEQTASFDVAQMQPTLLANILADNIGKNEFSETISAGVDVYVMLQQKAGFQTRDEAKKLFFRMLFSKPSNELERLFKGANFIQWINQYKDIFDDRNPHGKEKPYSNLAWLLQTYEVSVMSEIWRRFTEKRISFLTVHDEVICRVSDKGTAKTIIESVLSKHFKSYKLNVGHVEMTPQQTDSPETTPPTPSKPQPSKPKKSLYDIALQILGKQNNGTRSTLTAEMMQRYSISETRANDGFNQLVSSKIIELQTNVNRYYMTDSTPF